VWLLCWLSGRENDIDKMTRAISQGVPVVRMMVRTLKRYSQAICSTWLLQALRRAAQLRANSSAAIILPDDKEYLEMMASMPPELRRLVEVIPFRHS
jgi:hypothetical protein|tara:strand:- start:136 stop:426 length:291 start_codon:yes stop_codon:yes gene_type:complete